MSAGWFADPGQRHEYRYYDGLAWTDHIADSGVMGSEPLPPPPPQHPVVLPPPPPPPVLALAPSVTAPGSPPAAGTPPTGTPPADSPRQVTAWSEQRMREAAVWWANRRRGQESRDPGLPVLD